MSESGAPPMETVRYDTSFGPIELSAPPGVGGGAGPVVLVIRGAFAEPDILTRLAVLLGTDCAFANLPGHACPPLVGASVGLFAAAFREAIRQAFPARPVIVLGVSVGGLVAMALRLPQVRHLVLVDPPLSTGGLWPLTDRIRRSWPNLTPALRDFAWQVLGVSDAAAEDRRYDDLLAALDTPTDVLLGDVPLRPPRALDMIPCLNAPDAYAGHPHVRRHIVPGAGHNIPGQASNALVDVLRQACARVTALG